MSAPHYIKVLKSLRKHLKGFTKTSIYLFEGTSTFFQIHMLDDSEDLLSKYTEWNKVYILEFYLDLWLSWLSLPQISISRLSVGSAYTNVRIRRLLARWTRENHQKNRLGELNPNPKRDRSDIQIFIISLFTIITDQIMSCYSRIDLVF